MELARLVDLVASLQDTVRELKGEVELQCQQIDLLRAEINQMRRAAAARQRYGRSEPL